MLNKKESCPGSQSGEKFLEVENERQNPIV